MPRSKNHELNKKRRYKHNSHKTENLNNLYHDNIYTVLNIFEREEWYEFDHHTFISIIHNFLTRSMGEL